MPIKIVENSFFARIARAVLKTKRVAMVLGETIHLNGVDVATFLKNEEWVAHELCHIRQFKEHGYLRFLGLYLLESIKRGYYNNKYEAEARIAGASRTGLEALANYRQDNLPSSGVAPVDDAGKKV